MKFAVSKFGQNFGPRFFEVRSRAFHCKVAEKTPAATILLNNCWQFGKAFIRSLFARKSPGSANVFKTGQVVVGNVIERPAAQPVRWKDVFSRVVSKCSSDSWAAVLRRNTAKKLMFGTGNTFALLGFALAKEPSLLTHNEELDVICQEIREAFQKRPVSERLLLLEGPVSLAHLDIGAMFAKGCNAAVFSASWKPGVLVEEESNGNGDFGPLAVKMMFNYTAESNAAAIRRAMYRESVPAQTSSLRNTNRCKDGLPPHPNIVSMVCAFADYVPDLPEGPQLFPNALPPRLHHNGLGRNMTYFLVMKKYDCSLREYLHKHRPLTQTSLLLLTQLMEGLVHLQNHKVAHRDLKSDNILLDLTYGELRPQLVITDFGCCLAEGTLVVPLTSEDSFRGGNMALMAPEVITAEPGGNCTVNYSKSDVFAAGTIAYEMFGGKNPFYEEMPFHLESWSYQNEDLPPLPPHTPPPVQKVVRAMLDRNPQQRLSAVDAANVCQLLLLAPEGLPLRPQEVLLWLVALAGLSFYHQGEPEDALDQQLRCLFLARVQLQDTLSALRYIRN